MFYSINNWTCKSTAEMPKPWEHGFSYPTLLVTKESWIKWLSDPATKHAVISCNEGIAASVRVDKDNPIFRMHGILVDFDAPFDESRLANVIKDQVAEWQPNYIAQTFSDHARAYYAFERPVLIGNGKHYEAFTGILGDQLKLKKLLPGWEPEALQNAAKYYDIGRKWYPVAPDAKISADLLHLWLAEAAKKISFSPGEYRIPLEAVEAEIDRRWPGQWRGEFVVGARGRRFWDPSADNDSAVVLRPEGFLCYTGNQAFVSWRELLGGSFCQKFEAERTGAVIKNAVFDSRVFWEYNEDKERWRKWGKDDFSQHLRVKGFDSHKGKGEKHSEIDNIEGTIKEHRLVEAAVPFIYRPSGMLTWNGKTFLNTAVVRPVTPVVDGMMPPNPTWADLADRAPFLHAFLSHIFDGENDQLWHFLGWMKYFYEGGLKQDPQPGHIMIIAGAKGVGKTFLTQCIMSPLFGGHASAAAYMLQNNKWTADLADMPLQVVDDEISEGHDHRYLANFTAKLKTFAATGEIVYAEKFGAERTIPFPARVVLLTNIDPHSLSRCLPDMTMSMRDKVMLILTTDKEFPLFTTDRNANMAKAASELPILARWLLEWQYPESVREPGKSYRFGLRYYHHPELLAASNQQGGDLIVWNLICRTMLAAAENRKQGASEPSTWTGDIIKLYNDMSTVSPQIMREYPVRRLQLALQSIEKRKSFPIRRIKALPGQEIWEIDLSNILSPEKD
jgi:hypothetical protein